MNNNSLSPMKKALILLTVLLCCMAAAPQNAAAQSSMRTSSPVPPQVELMYVKGLRYLQNAQKTDGTYDGTYGQEPGIIGFCLMSVLAHGDDPNTGPYATMVRRCVNYILSKQNRGSGYIGDSMYNHGLSGMGPTYPVYRDIFMFQCLIGCRVSDLNRLTKANIVDGFVEYIPQKTKMEHANTVRVPLNQKAREILERYKDLENALLPRFSHFGYNKKIKEILKYVGIDRTVIVLDPKTREDVARPLYEVASTHTARKTFIGNLYRQVKDPNLIASMSGHSEGSRAFARYRKIDDEMKKELVNLLD